MTQMHRHARPAAWAGRAVLLGLVALIPRPGWSGTREDRGATAMMQVAREPGRGALRIRNRTPFVVTLHIAGVRVGWIRPFRTSTIGGLRAGVHVLFATSHYGTTVWGPSRIWVPGTWNLTPSSANRSSDDLETTIAVRLYRQGRGSLAACDSMARRRGETLDGTRTDFEIEVGRGPPRVKVKGEQLGPQLRACYSAVLRLWKYPKRRRPYTVSFRHLQRQGL